MRFWLLVFGGWLALSGLLFLSLVLAMGLPALVALGITVGFMLVMYWLWSRDVPAKDLQMRESLWNTPEDDDLTDAPK